MLHFAKLAQLEGAAGLVVGTELSSLEPYGPRWRSLIADVRHRFKGFVTYDANWGKDPERISWWSSLDAISVSAYYPLAVGEYPTVAQLIAGWQPWLAQLRALHQEFGKPVMFGEIGYRTIADAAARPFDSTVQAPYSPITQAQAYEAALRVWHRVPWFRGFQWWLVLDQPARPGASGEDYAPSPAAEAVLARWYSSGR